MSDRDDQPECQAPSHSRRAKRCMIHVPMSGAHSPATPNDSP
jgi:hypothetical protein